MSNFNEVKDKPEFENTQEIIEYICKLAAEKPATFTSTMNFHWECAISEEHFKDPYAKMRNRWSDAAYQGDWDMVFKVCILPNEIQPGPHKRRGHWL
jgi:radical SAM superfamily enzyme YgiQ (UPF0313 family)